jgi:hypothetical protein
MNARRRSRIVLARSDVAGVRISPSARCQLFVTVAAKIATREIRYASDGARSKRFLASALLTDLIALVMIHLF